jgi:hypothetical protein
MAFQATNTSDQIKRSFIQLFTEKDPTSGIITGKFFQVTTKNPQTNQYDKELMKSGVNPKPFFGYLIRIEKKLDATITKKIDSTVIPDPHLVFVFNDGPNDTNEYHLKMKFNNDKGQVDINTGTLINTLAGCKKFGYFKISIVESTDKTGKKRHNIYLRNDTNYQGNINSFYGPKDGSEDKTKTTWLHTYDQIPPISIKAQVNGKLKDVDNTEEHQEFYLNMIDNHIQHKIEKYLESVTKTKTESYNHTTVESEVEDEEYEETTLQETSLEVDDDLPF